MILDIGDRLKSLRLENNLTKKQAAKLVGVSPKTIENYELGNRKPKLEILVDLANNYNTTTDYILGRQSEKYGFTLTARQINNLSEMNQKLMSYLDNKNKRII